MKTGVSTSKRVYFWMFLPSLASVMAARRVFARSCSLLSKYLPISWKQRKEQSHAQCHVTHRIRTFDKTSEHVKVPKSVDIAVPELAVTSLPGHPYALLRLGTVRWYELDGIESRKLETGLKLSSKGQSFKFKSSSFVDRSCSSTIWDSC